MSDYKQIRSSAEFELKFGEDWRYKMPYLFVTDMNPLAGSYVLVDSFEVDSNYSPMDKYRFSPNFVYRAIVDRFYISMEMTKDPNLDCALT